MIQKASKLHRDLESESAVLGSMILDWRRCGDVQAHIKNSNEFFDAKHCAIFHVLMELYDEGVQYDMVRIRRRLDDRRLMEQVSGLDYLMQLAESVPSASSAEHYAKLVHESFLLRQFSKCASQIVEVSEDSSMPIRDAIDAAESLIFQINTESDSGTVNTIGELLQQSYNTLESGVGERGIVSGFHPLDELTNGFKPGEFIVVAARPSMGKTAFAIQIALHASITNEVPTALYSMEMSREQIGMRIFSTMACVDSGRIRRRTLSKEEFDELSSAAGRAASSLMMIDDKSSLSLLDLRSRARRLKSSNNIQMVIVDYLQLMEGKKAESRQQQVSDLSRGLKNLARELDVAVVCLSQLNRASQSRTDNKPKLSDLRDSGAIEQDADLVILLHRDDYYKQDDPKYEKNHEADVIVAKQRNGPTGVLKLHFEGKTMSFQGQETRAW